MNTTQDNRNLEHMLELSKLGADGHKERRELEFRIFVSYLTGLALLFYQINKPEDPILQKPDNFWLTLALSIPLLLIHYIYCSWQRNIAIALINDVRRRDFYLLKAQCLSYHLSRNSNTEFQARRCRTHSINMGGGRSCEISERCLFKKDAPKTIKEPSWSEFWKLRWDPHIWLQIGVPTIVLSILMISIRGWLWTIIVLAALIPVGRLDCPDTICSDSRKEKDTGES